jgi:hypothetical protein
MKKAALEKDSAFEEGSAHWPMWAIHLEGAMAASQTVLPWRVDAVCRLSNICEQWAFAA